MHRFLVVYIHKFSFPHDSAVNDSHTDTHIYTSRYTGNMDSQQLNSNYNYLFKVFLWQIPMGVEIFPQWEFPCSSSSLFPNCIQVHNIIQNDSSQIYNMYTVLVKCQSQWLWLFTKYKKNMYIQVYIEYF